MTKKENNVVSIGHNSNQLTDKLFKAVNILNQAYSALVEGRNQSYELGTGINDAGVKLNGREKIETLQRSQLFLKNSIDKIEDADAIIRKIIDNE